MARVAGVDIPNKHLSIALTYIYGIGRTLAMKICEEAKLDPNKMANDLTQDEIGLIREVIEKNYKIEGRLRSEIGLNLKRLIDIVGDCGHVTPGAAPETWGHTGDCGRVRPGA